MLHGLSSEANGDPSGATRGSAEGKVRKGFFCCCCCWRRGRRRGGCNAKPRKPAVQGKLAEATRGGNGKVDEEGRVSRGVRGKATWERGGEGR